MAVDMFLKIDGIKGESQDKKHKDQIDLMSWSWGASNAGSHSTGGGGGAGKVSMQDFHFTMQLNKATPELMLACATGKHIPSAVLVCRKAGGEQQEYLEVKFSDLLVSSYQTGNGGGGDIPVESVSLNFSKIEYSYSPQDDKGKLGTALKASYNLKTNSSK